MSVENGVVEHGSRFGRAFISDQDAHYVVTFAVEWRKEEDEQRQHGRTEGIARQVVFERGEHAFKSIHGAREIQRRYAADQAQQNRARHTRNDERIVERHLKHGGSARNKVGYARRRGTRDEQGHKGRHGQVNHQHLDGENQSGDGGFINAGDSSRRTAAH